jgi:hypothetical protein
MIQDMDKLEVSIPILFKARQKYEKCKHMVKFCGQMSCNLFHYTFDSNFDILHHCASCKLNTKKPTTFNEHLRFS